MIISDDDFAKAIDRIARSSDGLVLYHWLQKTLCGVMTTSDDGALRENNGERRFAARLMSHMAQGIRDSDRSGSSAITFAVSGARSIARTGGAGRRVTADPAEPGTGPDAV